MALTITRIPEPYRGGFAKIKDLSGETVAAIEQAINKLPPTSRIQDMVSAVSEHVPTIKKDDAEIIVRALYSLYVFRAGRSSEASLSEVVLAVVGALRSSSKEFLALSEDEKTEFQDKLAKLLGSKALEISAKVQQLKSDYASIFYDAIILSDLRPVFADPGERPIGAAITQTLKITYHEAGDHKEMYFTLDAEDIQKIKRVVERAEAKTSSLKALIKTSDLTDLS